MLVSCIRRWLENSSSSEAIERHPWVVVPRMRPAPARTRTFGSIARVIGAKSNHVGRSDSLSVGTLMDHFRARRASLGVLSGL
jgi:hypothetical protein